MHTRDTRSASIARQRCASAESQMVDAVRIADVLIGDVELLLEDARRLALMIVRAHSTARLATAAVSGHSAPTRGETAA